MRKILALVAVMMLFGVVAVYGQAIGDLKGKMAVGAFLDYGIGFGDQFKSYDYSYGEVSVSAQNKLQLSFGGHFMYGLAPKIAIKGLIDYQTEKWEISGSIPGYSASTSETYHWLEISANGMYFFSPEKRMCPYIEAGPGMYSFGGNGASSDTKLGVNAGLGGMYFLNPNLAIDAGGRFHIIFTDVKNTTYVDIHAGVTLFFGGTK